MTEVVTYPNLSKAFLAYELYRESFLLVEGGEIPLGRGRLADLFTMPKGWVSASSGFVNSDGKNVAVEGIAINPKAAILARGQDGRVTLKFPGDVRANITADFDATVAAMNGEDTAANQSAVRHD